MQRIILLFSILLIFTGKAALAQLPDFCLTKDEYRLYTLINEYRTKNGLGIIPISRSLCYVAKVHARDLYLNNPDTSICSLNSWSDKGQWTACCHSGATPSPACIVNKPKELTKYPGEGHEIAYWESEQLNPDTIVNFWKSVDATKEILLNQKRWSYFSWKAIGIGLYKGYACVWVGDQPDIEPEPTLCSNGGSVDDLALPYKSIVQEVVSKPTGRFYIIFGSFNTKEDAEKMVSKYRKEGFVNAKILASDKTNYRVSLNDFASQQEALDAKNKLGSQYKDAWITKY
jgi:hypothetical protein